MTSKQRERAHQQAEAEKKRREAPADDDHPDSWFPAKLLDDTEAR